MEQGFGRGYGVAVAALCFSVGCKSTGHPSGSDGGAGGQAGGAPDGGPAFPGCPGHEIVKSGVLDLDLRAIHLSGNVTLGGGALPDERGSRGMLMFEDVAQHAFVFVDLGATGPISYALTLPPGRYDVRLTGNSLCSQSSAPAVPCGGGVIMSRVLLSADAVLDVDIPIARVSGTLTLAGAPLPGEAVDRGKLEFVDEEGTVFETRGFGPSGAATYEVTLLPGRYDVRFFGQGQFCERTQPSPIPCNRGVILRDADITTGVLDLDIGAVQVTGTVSQAGGSLPDEADSRGRLVFVASELPLKSFALTRDLGATGVASYAVTLLPGTYDVSFNGNYSFCLGTTPSRVPCNSGTVVRSVALTANRVLDIDLSAVTVSGTATFKGGPFPTESSDRGSVAFVNASGGPTPTRPFGISGAATYQVTMLAGDYSVSYVANPGLCAGRAVPGLPCIGGPVAPPRSLTKSGVFDIDVRSVRVTGAVTVNGSPPGDVSAARSQIVFAGAGGGTIAIPLGALDASGALGYGLTLLPDSYAVRFLSNPSSCYQTAAPPRLPCGGGTLIPAVSLAADRVLDIDIPLVNVMGAVTLLGAPLPDGDLIRGGISFSLVDPINPNPAYGPDLGVTGPGVYSVGLLPGRYVVSHGASSSSCGPGLSPAIPCTSQVLRGCE